MRKLKLQGTLAGELGCPRAQQEWHLPTAQEDLLILQQA